MSTKIILGLCLLSMWALFTMVSNILPPVDLAGETSITSLNLISQEFPAAVQIVPVAPILPEPSADPSHTL